MAAKISENSIGGTGEGLDREIEPSTGIIPEARERMAGWIPHGKEERVRLVVDGGWEQGQDRSLLRGASDEARGYAE